jgi:hypothetical protein
MLAILAAALLMFGQAPDPAASAPTDVAPAEVRGKRTRHMDAGGAANATLNDTRSAEVGDPNRVVCKKVTAIGTRLGAEKVCRTAREWAELQRDSKDATHRRQRVGWSD